MEIHSSVGRLSAFRPEPTSAYQQLSIEYLQSGFTYKSNQILQKAADNNPNHYPYEMLLHVVKIFHLNQFEIIFLSHILSDVEPCYSTEPQLFNDIEITPQVNELIRLILTQQGSRNTYLHPAEQFNIILKSSQDELKREQECQDMKQAPFSNQQLKRVYSYLLVLGYAVKYYLNQQLIIKPYDEQIRARHPTFFASIFNKWAKKYGNSALATTPRRINSYYLNLASQLEVDENVNNNNNEENCQYRNYNEIVEELIKATTEGEDYIEVEKEVEE